MADSLNEKLKGDIARLEATICDLKNTCADFRAEEAQASERMHRIEKAISDLNIDYWLGIEECYCDRELPTGGCLYCDLMNLKQALGGAE